jgi:hypothetical protein
MDTTNARREDGMRRTYEQIRLDELKAAASPEDWQRVEATIAKWDRARDKVGKAIDEHHELLKELDTKYGVKYGVPQIVKLSNNLRGVK